MDRLPVPDPGEGGPGPRRGRPPAGRREAILRATLDLLGQDGLSRLTTREVARRAGVSEASVFYHFADKAGLLQAAVLAGLEPLKALEPEVLSGSVDRPLADTLAQFAAAMEAFFARAMPVLAAVQSDAPLRVAFAQRLVEGDNGPHRGVRLVADCLTGLKAQGRVDSGADAEAAAMLVVSTSFLRTWEHQMAGPGRLPTLPERDAVIRSLVALLEPRSAPSPPPC